MNPWKNLPCNPPFVLEEDSSYINTFNEIQNNANFKINTNYVPEARLGPVNAPVVILQLNPSYNRDEAEGPNELEIKKDLENIMNEGEYHKGGYETTNWWNTRLNNLRCDVGEEKLAKNLLSVEFFPYRSLNFDHNELRIPSQKYSFDLVRNALKNNAVVVVGRGWKLWCSAIPELYEQFNDPKSEHGTVFRLNNPRSSYYSRNNLGEDPYNKIVNVINGA